MSDQIISTTRQENKEIFKDTKQNPQKKSLQTKAKFLNQQRNKHHPNSLLKLNSKIFRFNVLSIILFLLISISMPPIINSSQKNELRGLNDDTTNNYIILTIQGKGEQAIISESYTDLPNSIKINENTEITGTINRVQELDIDGLNTIKMTWTSKLTTCLKMFKDIPNLITADLTNFDFSIVNDMESMFEGCTFLKSVDLSNNDGSNVSRMTYMFRNCISLESVNFNNFKTQKIENIGQMFLNCENIRSIDLSSFETSNLLFISHIFSGCHSVIQI